MKEFMSHFSAAYYWGIPNLDAILQSKHKDKRQSKSVMETTVTDVHNRYKKKLNFKHETIIPLPRNAVIRCSIGYVASPELVFLELANYLNLHQLILLGLQMCAHCVGEPSRAISTKYRLDAFLKKTPGHYGHKKAVRALKYIQNGSASIMESIVFMVLTLPNSLGGYGLDGVQFNHEIIFDSGSSQKRCFADLYYSKAKVAVEYDSFTHHNTPKEQSKDLIRATTLKKHGIEVIRFGTQQLYDKNKCEDFALSVASSIGKRVRIRCKGFYREHNKIRELLPRKKQPSNQTMIQQKYSHSIKQ
jgi:very-short-patch-repair endonuclease